MDGWMDGWIDIAVNHMECLSTSQAQVGIVLVLRLAAV